MNDSLLFKNQLLENGFSMVEDVYSFEEVRKIIDCIEQADKSNDTFRKSVDLFAIRQFLKEIPETAELVFNQKLISIVHELLGNDAFVVKSIYFDKPETSNWYVAYHQDLTISVDRKTDIDGFGPWTTKQNQFAVQPPVEYLENIITIRVHLDDTNAENGALKVVPKSHLKKIYRPETIDWSTEKETICNVAAGGVMLMKPLTLHSSARTTNNKKRRVIHIELSNMELPEGLAWAERATTEVSRAHS